MTPDPSVLLRPEPRPRKDPLSVDADSLQPTAEDLEPEELTAPDVPITDPFNPEDIKISGRRLLVEQLVRRLSESEVNLAPDFQRNLIWKPTQKSRLIESLLLKIPLPVFYVASDPKDDWDVVDGIQRMSTIHDYVGGRFALRDLEYLSSLDDLTFDALPRRLQRRILETELLVNVIEHGTPEEVMFNVFTRINTSGTPLNAQEIRHALHRGPARQFLKELAARPEFQEATDGSVPGGRMQDRECVLRFLAFYLDPWEGYGIGSNLDSHLREAMKTVSAMPETGRQRTATDFKRAMRAARQIFDNRAFRKVRDGDEWRRPINRALFETWSVELALCSEEVLDILCARRGALVNAFVSKLADDAEFERSISVGTGDWRRVRKRFQTVRSLVEAFSC